MITPEMKEFNAELLEDIRELRRGNSMSQDDAFTCKFTEYVVEAGETFLSNCEVISYNKKSEKMKINGYAIDEYFQTLTLIVSDFSNRPEILPMGKGDIDNNVKQATRFYRCCKTTYFDQVEESDNGYMIFEAARDSMRNIRIIKVILLTNKEAVNYTPADIKIDRCIVKFDVWDLERLCQSIYQNIAHEQLTIRLKSKYGYTLPMIKVLPEIDEYSCYVGIIPGNLLANIYKDEGQRLIEKNVRSFLQATGKVNRGIRDTLTKESEMFMAYNNGISTIAMEIITVDHDGDDCTVLITEIKNWQIVNGGQTTASIYNALQNKISLNNVNVMMKLTVIKQEEKVNEMIAKISEYANTQNKINMSDFNANDEYHVQMERFSRTTFVPVEQGKSTNRWFYERARGQYMVELNRQPTEKAKREFKEKTPKNQCISKTVAAKCQMCWMKYPDVVSKGLETNFIEFSEKIQDGEIPAPSRESYISMIAKVILFRDCDKLVEAQKFGGYKAQINYYTIALLSEFCADKVDDEYIWQHQTVSPELSLLIDELILKVWSHFMHPKIQGINITQWCKKEECWTLLKSRFRQKLI